MKNNILKRIKFMVPVVLVFVSIVTACNSSRYYKGKIFTYIGYPTAKKLIWSRADLEKILVSISTDISGSQIFIQDISSGEKQIVAETSSGYLDAETWSPDGRQVIFSADPNTKGYEHGGLWIWDARDNSIEFFQDGYHADWSPDGKTILITKIDSLSPNEMQGNVILDFINVAQDEEDKVYIIEKVDMAHIPNPSWAPDGQDIVFLVNKMGVDKSGLYILNTKTFELRQLPEYGEYLDPVWSPNGKIIVYQKQYQIPNQDGRKYGLFFINPDGSCHQGTALVDTLQSPQWSPDNQKFAFIGPDGIYLVDFVFFVSDIEDVCNLHGITP
jgi:Tol biopolymer transport system component